MALQRAAGNRAVTGLLQQLGARREPVQRQAQITSLTGVVPLTRARALRWLKADGVELYPDELKHLDAFLASSTKTYSFIETDTMHSELEGFTTEQTGLVRGEVVEPDEPEPAAAYRIIRSTKEPTRTVQEVEFKRGGSQPRNGLLNNDGYFYEDIGSSAQGILYRRFPVQGGVGFFRGFHFKATWSPEKHKEEIEKIVLGSPTHSSASYEIALRTASDPTNATTAELEAATLIVKKELAAMENYLDLHKPDKRQTYLHKPRQPGQHEKFTRKNRQYLNQLAAALSLYVNNQKEFEKQLVKGTSGDFGGLTFLKIPFISTSKSAKEAAKYAKGKVQKDEDLREDGIVGRIFIYVAPLHRMLEEKAVDIVSSHPTKIYICEWRFGEKEITFSGVVPGEFLRGQMNVKSKDSVEDIGARADTIAERQANPLGGLTAFTS